jgi:hypothetical protein
MANSATGGLSEGARFLRGSLGGWMRQKLVSFRQRVRGQARAILLPCMRPEVVMHNIKLHLAQPEYDAIARYANSLQTKPEAVAYAALNRFMLDAHKPEVRKDIVETWRAHTDNLPLWSHSAGYVHPHEGKPDDAPEPVFIMATLV